MANGMPELGSKISLISKADIRYEGRLFTVDPQECTIALANVRSFGTEDRETQYPIAPQSQIYDYILFRGSDIKDIRVVNNSMPHPTDPAIMQMQLPNGQHVMPHFPPMQPMNTPMGNYHPPQQQQPPSAVGMGGFVGGGGGGGNSSVVGGGLAPPALLQQQQQQTQQQQPLHQHPNQQQQQQQVPPHPPQQSQPSSQQQQQSHHNQSVGGSVVGSSSTSSSATGLLNVGGSGSAPNSNVIGGGLMAMTNNNITNASSNSNNVSVIDLLAGASRSTTPMSLLSRNKSPSADMAVQVNQQQSIGNRDAGHKRQPNQLPLNRGTYNRDRRDSGRGMNDYVHNQYDNRNQYRNNQGQQNRGGWMNRNTNMNNMRNNHPNNRGRGNGGPPRMNQGFRPQYVNKGNRPASKPLKFDDDFDFEKANTQFEELINVFSKTKVSDDPKNDLQVNGEIEKKDDSGNETGAGEHENEEENICYDKTKSFFDSISCEAAQDRSKNKKNDWRQERKINTETFGIPAKRTNYRGRGNNFYNRNVNYRGYRPQNNGYQHNRNRNYSNRSQSTGIPLKSLNTTNDYNSAPAETQSQQLTKTLPESIVDHPSTAVVVAAVK